MSTKLDSCVFQALGRCRVMSFIWEDVRGEVAKERVGWRQRIGRGLPWREQPKGKCVHYGGAVVHQWLPLGGILSLSQSQECLCGLEDTTGKGIGVSSKWVNLEWTIHSTLAVSSWLHNMVYMNHKAGFPPPSPAPLKLILLQKDIK